jgi:hypothetical protein
MDPNTGIPHTQQRATSKTFQRCQRCKEDFSHIFQCNEQTACAFRQDAICHTLNEIVKVNTNIYILHSLEKKLAEHMKVTSLGKYIPANFNKEEHASTPLATKHQNIIRWKNFLCRYIYIKRSSGQHHNPQNKKI